MNGNEQNSLEFFEEISKEWCVSEEQYKPFWNDVLTFARKYHKERISHDDITQKMAIGFKVWCESGRAWYWDNIEQRSHSDQELYELFKHEQQNQKKLK